MPPLAAERQTRGGDEMDLTRKKEIILERESDFATAVGSAVVEKPKATPWIVLMPFMFIFLINDMLKFKRNRRKFDDEFMINRRQAMDVAFESVVSGSKPDIGLVVRKSNCMAALEKPYTAWIEALVDHYTDLLSAPGNSFEAIVRSAYRNRTTYLLILNRLNTVETEFFMALKACMKATDGAADVITAIQNESQRLHRDLAEQVFN
jgi:hypothetical protein